MDLFDNDFEAEMKKAAESIEEELKCSNSSVSFIDGIRKVLSGESLSIDNLC